VLTSRAFHANIIYWVVYPLNLRKEVFTVTNEHSHEAMPITKKSIKMTKLFPEFFRGSVYVANGLFYTDRQYRRFLKRGRRIKLRK